MAKTSGERLSALETELPHLWREIKSMADISAEHSKLVSKVSKEVEKMRSALYAAVMLLGALIVQTSGEPVVKFLVTALKSYAIASLK